MAMIDEELILSRAQFALEAMAIGQSLLDRDLQEAGFRTHLILAHASQQGYEGVMHAARLVAALLKDAEPVIIPGIGRALLNLSDAIDAI
jgi:hypothetical protein